MAKKVGILFGMEDTFPWAFIDEVNAQEGARSLPSPSLSTRCNKVLITGIM